MTGSNKLTPELLAKLDKVVAMTNRYIARELNRRRIAKMRANSDRRRATADAQPVDDSQLGKRWNEQFHPRYKKTALQGRK